MMWKRGNHEVELPSGEEVLRFALQRDPVRGVFSSSADGGLVKLMNPSGSPSPTSAHNPGARADFARRASISK